MFIEERLLDIVAYGFSGGPTYNTTRVELFSGLVSRNAERARPLYKYAASYESVETEHHDTIIQTYNACMGSLHGFRFKDWADYILLNSVLGTAVGGADETMQLIKTYTFGPVSTVRPIIKPVDGSLTLYADGLEIASVLDATTGIVTFDAVVGQAITATCEFDVPVMFDSDQLSFSFVNWKAHSTDISLVEDFAA